MSETLFLPETSERKAIYNALYPQIESLLSGEQNYIARLANFSAILKEAFDFFWVGFYLVDTVDELVLGPFQGSLACMRIRYGRGVCGTAWKEKRTLLVPDVEKFPGHIACSSLSRSEIVIPLFRNDEVIGVLDIDSDRIDDFSEIDVEGLEKLVSLL